jgi:hypothetical protein
MAALFLSRAEPLSYVWVQECPLMGKARSVVFGFKWGDCRLTAFIRA